MAVGPGSVKLSDVFREKIHVKLSYDSLFAVKIFIDFSEN